MFPVGLYLLALVGGAVISAASLPLWRRWCEHVGLLDTPGPRKIHKHPVPLAGDYVRRDRADDEEPSP